MFLLEYLDILNFSSPKSDKFDKAHKKYILIFKYFFYKPSTQYKLYISKLCQPQRNDQI